MQATSEQNTLRSFTHLGSRLIWVNRFSTTQMRKRAGMSHAKPQSRQRMTENEIGGARAEVGGQRWYVKEADELLS